MAVEEKKRILEEKEIQRIRVIHFNDNILFSVCMKWRH